MTTIASISFFFSSFVDNAIGPIVGTMGVIIICSIITLMPIQLFDAVRPHLFTSYLDLWSRVFAEPIRLGKNPDRSTLSWRIFVCIGCRRVVYFYSKGYTLIELRIQN